jgi:hypothetical protein
MSNDPKIKALVESFTQDLSALIHEAALASVQQALANVGLATAPAKRGAKKAGKKRGRPVGSKSAPKAATASSGSAAPKATKKKAASKKSAAGGGGGDAALADRVAAFVASKQGTGLGAIAFGVKAKKPAVQVALRALLDAGRIRKTGERKGTQYFGK